METRQYSGRREMVDWQGVTDGLGQSVLVCIPLSVVPTVTKFLLTRAKWRTTYVKSYISSQHYEIPSAAEFDPVEDEIDAFIEELHLVSTCDQISTELANIVTQIGLVKTSLDTLNTTLAALDLSGLDNLANIPQAADFNDLEEEFNEIITIMGGAPVTLS